MQRVQGRITRQLGWIGWVALGILSAGSVLLSHAPALAGAADDQRPAPAILAPAGVRRDTLAGDDAAPTGRPGGGVTATPTRPPTPCPPAAVLMFSDVDPNNPFYVYIRCLACRGIVSGYADGTFRWGNPVTRGQLAKIIASAAGLDAPIPPNQQTFADVPPSNPFWLWIERLAATGAIGGYGCGGPGEPCDAQYRPYFRWNQNATRGQIAKITVVAANINDPVPSTQQTFTDVELSNTFWPSIERLSDHGIVDGYTCGGPGEPCDGGNRPYFRWGSPTTRGQMSKIAANTFYPHCDTPARP